MHDYIDPIRWSLKRPANYTPVCELAADNADGAPCNRLPSLIAWCRYPIDQKKYPAKLRAIAVASWPRNWYVYFISIIIFWVLFVTVPNFMG